MVKRISEKKGFSLAEALIALTIVGIIAMLVLPSLRKTSSLHSFSIQLKKDYMTLNNSLDAVFADDFDTDIEEMGGDAFFVEKMIPKLNVVQQCGESNMYESTEGTRDACMASGIADLPAQPKNAVVLADGSTIANNNMHYIVDVNGPDLPNIVGVDVFAFELKKVKADSKEPDDNGEASGSAGTVAMLTPMLNGAISAINSAFVPAAYAALNNSYTTTGSMQGDDIWNTHHSGGGNTIGGNNTGGLQHYQNAGGGGGGGSINTSSSSSRILPSSSGTSGSTSRIVLPTSSGTSGSTSRIVLPTSSDCASHIKRYIRFYK